MLRVSTLRLHHDIDVVSARRRAAEVAGLLGFPPPEQTRIATAVSEIARNAFRYGDRAELDLLIDADNTPQSYVMRIRDRGPGIPHLREVLAGSYRSETGLGLGITGARRLMDGFRIDSSAAGTTVVMRKDLTSNGRRITAPRVREIAHRIDQRGPQTLVEEIQRQNDELLRAFEELQRRQDQLVHLNRELEDTNRGVVALYAELDEKALRLRQADELKSRFLSHMTHEFRTPVNAILGLTRVLMDARHREARDPELEIVYLRQAAQQLSAVVDDLLDVAQIDAGKTVVRPSAFEVADLFGALRGMLRPLLLTQSVALVFDDPVGLPAMHTDEAKLSQILRNLVSNALKFTERGEVRVTAALDGDCMVFVVSDTGIGIAPEDQERIFDEFVQLEHSLQHRVRGTGLGLPLSQRLAELLGGTLTVTSTPGVGSAFSLRVPVTYAAPRAAPARVDRHVAAAAPAPVEASLRVLAIDDQEIARFLVRQMLPEPAYTIFEAASGDEGLELARRERPHAILLDMMLPEPTGLDVLQQLSHDPATAAIPVIVLTSAALSERLQRRLARDAAAVISKRDLDQDALAAAVHAAVAGARDRARERPTKSA